MAPHSTLCNTAVVVPIDGRHRLHFCFPHPGLTTHLWVIHGEGKGNIFTCEQCGYTTKVHSLYRNHLMNLHNIGEYKPGLCPICGMTFKTKAYLMDHMYKVHKKTLKGKDTKAAQQDRSSEENVMDENG